MTKYLSFMLMFSFATATISFSLDLYRADFSASGAENCADSQGEIYPNPSTIEEGVCSRITIKFGIFGQDRFVDQHIKVECVEPGVVDVSFYSSCLASVASTVQTFVYGTCTQLPPQLYGFNGRTIWEGGCISSDVSTSAPPSFSPTKNPATTHPSVKPSTSPSKFPTPNSPTHMPSKFPTSSDPSGVPSASPSSPPSTSPSSFPSVGPSTSPSAFPTSNFPTQGPTIGPSASVPSVSPTLSPTNPTTSPSIAPTTLDESIIVKMEVEGSSCATVDKGEVAAATADACGLSHSKVEVPHCIEKASANRRRRLQNDSPIIAEHWINIESRDGGLRTYIVSENFTTSVNQILSAQAVLLEVSIENYIPTAKPIRLVDDDSTMDTGTGVMFLVMVFIFIAWIIIHVMLYWRFSFYNSATLFRWESFTWTLFLAHSFDFCSDVFVCYETSHIFGTSDWTFIVSLGSLCMSIIVNFYHLIKFLNFAFRNPDTKHWLLKDNGLQMIVFIFLLCGGNPSFLSALVSMVIINRVPLTAMEIMHFSSHRWTVVIIENIPQLLVGIWTLQESESFAKMIVVLSIAFSAISSISILIITWYQSHNEIIPVRMQIEIHNIPRLRTIHFIPVQKLLEKTHEGISIEVYHLQQTAGGLQIKYAVYEIHKDKYKKAKKDAIKRFTKLFKDRTNWVHKQEDVEDFTQLKGTARRIKTLDLHPNQENESQKNTANPTTTVEGEGEADYYESPSPTEFDIGSHQSPTIFDFSGSSTPFTGGESIAMATLSTNFTFDSNSDSHMGDCSPEGGENSEGVESPDPLKRIPTGSTVESLKL